MVFSDGRDSRVASRIANEVKRPPRKPRERSTDNESTTGAKKISVPEERRGRKVQPARRTLTHVSGFPYLLAREPVHREVSGDGEPPVYIIASSSPAHHTHFRIYRDEVGEERPRTYLRASAFRDFAVRGHRADDSSGFYRHRAGQRSTFPRGKPRVRFVRVDARSLLEAPSSIRLSFGFSPNSLE